MVLLIDDTITLHQCTLHCPFPVYHCDSTVLSYFVLQYGMTAYMWAIVRGHTDVLQLFLSIGAHVDLQNEVRHSIHHQYEPCQFFFNITLFIECPLHMEALFSCFQECCAVSTN